MQTVITPPDAQADSLATLQNAIRNHQVVQFKTDAGWRTVEPHRIGYVKSEPLLILVYGYSRDTVVSQDTPSRWQVFRLDEMHRLSLTAYSFEARHDYQDPTYLSDSLFGQLVWLSHGISQPSQSTRPNRVDKL